MGKYTIPAYVQFIQLLQYYEGTYIICSKSLITFCFSERVHKGIKVAFSNICTTKYSADPEESKVNHSIRIYSIGERLYQSKYCQTSVTNRIIFQITIELGIRGKNDVPDDTDINLEAQVKDHPDTKQTIALKVAQDMALIPLIICKTTFTL